MFSTFLSVNGHSVIDHIPADVKLSKRDRALLVSINFMFQFLIFNPTNFLQKSLNKYLAFNQVENFKALIENEGAQSLLFVHQGLDRSSLFEEILMCQENVGAFISLIWVVCKLWRGSTILTKVFA